MPKQPNIPLGDEFTSREWVNYTTFDAVTKEHLSFQKHLDIRPFTQTAITANGGDLLAPEHWVLPAESSTGPQAALNNFAGLKLKIKAGTVEAVSEVTEHALNLKEGFVPTDLLVFGLPKFPLAHVTTASSYLELVDDDGEVTKVKFSASTTTLEAGNTHFSVPLSVLEAGKADLTTITIVRFKVVGTVEDTVYITDLRIIEAPGENPETQPGWVQSSIDFDNWNGRLHKTVPLADPETKPAYEQSILWRSAPLSGPTDPQPVDTEFGIVFNVGDLASSNEFTMYFRQESKIFTTMLDLIGVSMAELDGQPQPDLGTREFLPRTVGEYDEAPMEELDTFDMEELERRSVPNPVLESWVYFTFSWNKKVPTISMGNNSGIGYNFPGLEGLTLTANHNYFVTFALEGSKARARLYDLDQTNEDGGLIETEPAVYVPTTKYFLVNQHPLFDTTIVDDGNVFRRRKGRVGFSATFKDADAFVRSIRPRGVTFAEYRSAPLASHTPVAGASLFVSALPGDTSLWKGDLSLYPANTTHAFTTFDKSRTLTKNGASYRLTNKGVPKQSEYQGFQTEFMNFTDWSQMQIEFDLWFNGPAREKEKIETLYRGFYPGSHSYPGAKRYPGAKIIVETEPTFASIIARLVSTDGTVIPLTMPELETFQWQHIVLRVPLEEVVQTGFYQLQILQQTRLATNWWVDRLKVLQRSVEWSARSVADDPWGGTYAPWTGFMDVTNDAQNNGGISLEPRGKELQMRARARRQDVTIVMPKLVPRYAELGRLVWPENAYHGTPPTALFKAAKEKTEELEFTDESTPGSGAIINREWSFGDGTRSITNASKIKHKYAKAGKYSVTLVATDRHGQTNSKIKEVEAT